MNIEKQIKNALSTIEHWNVIADGGTIDTMVRLKYGHTAWKAVQVLLKNNVTFECRYLAELIKEYDNV
jgi:hypothetical protein